MVGLAELFTNLGIDPTRRQGPASAGEFQRSNPIAFDALFDGIVSSRNNAPTGLSLAASSEVAPSFGMLGGAGDDDGGGGWKSALGDVFNAAIRVIDTPRAVVVSSIKEARDAIHNDGWSWSDWADQGLGEDHIGFGEIVEEAFPDAPMWVKRSLGFVGDVGLDPLTWTGAGAAAKGGAKAGSAADDALRVAVRGGGRKEISEALWVKAGEVGLLDAPDVQKLVNIAAKRGRGALTPRSLSVLDDASKEALNLPRLTRTFARKPIPFSGKYSEGLETVRGALKEGLGKSGAAKFYRQLRVGEQNGRRALTGIIRTSDDPEKVAAAVGMLRHSLSAARLADARVDVWTRGLRQELGDEVHRLDRPMAAQLVEDIERGVMSADTEPFRRTMQNIHDELTAAGVDMGWLPNYVPHVATYEARIAARTDKTVAKWVRDLNSTSFFEEERLLVPGANFLGEVVPDGATIRWFNEVSQAKVGFKFFEDDIRDVVSIYMGQARNSLYRANLRVGLVQSGVAKARPFTAELDDAQRAAFGELEHDLKMARKDTSVVLASGAKVRRDAIETFSQALGVRRREIMVEMRKLKLLADDLGRQYTDLVAKVEAAKGRVAVYQLEVDKWTPIAAKARGAARGKAQRAKRLAEKHLGAAEKELSDVQGALDKFLKETMPRGGRYGYRMEAVAGPMRETISDLKVRAEALADEFERVSAEHEELLQHVTPLGDLPFARASQAERVVGANKRAVKSIVEGIDGDVTKLGEIDLLMQDTAKIVADLEPKIQQVQQVYAKARAARRHAPSAKNSAILSDELYELMHMFEPRAHKLTLKNGTPAGDLLYRQQAAALGFDIKVALGRQKEADIQSMLRTMSAPGFGNKIVYDLENGMAALGDMHSIPQWAEDALQVRGMLKDPEFFPNAVKYLRQFENLWKGWAVARPGFILRNVLSSLFNVYVEGGVKSIVSMREFRQFFDIYRKNPATYLDEAAQIWDAGTVKRLDEALSVIPATGGGLSAAEFHTDMLRRPSWNPTKPEFGPIYATRHLNEYVEATIRGGHAYDVLRRGGDANLATDIVAKWHFNYRDITDFDRQMKHVIPFWMFFSNNVALQSQVWATKLPKLNRSYLAMRRSAFMGQPEEEGAPDWLERQMGIPVKIDPDGTSRYLNVGNPSIQFATDAMNAIDRPTSLLANLGPLAGLPAEAVAGKNFYTGNDLSGYRDAGMYGMLGLGTETGSGGRALTPYQMDILNGLLPGFSTANRLGGGTGDAGGAWLGWLGAATSKVTPETRLATERRRQRAESAAKYKKKILEEM